MGSLNLVANIKSGRTFMNMSYGYDADNILTLGNSAAIPAGATAYTFG